MGMYTQVCGVLNVTSIYGDPKIDVVKSKIDEIAHSMNTWEYWNPKRLLTHVNVVDGGNGSVFICIAVEGKIVGYGEDWHNFIKKACSVFPTLQGRIEWLYEDNEGNNVVWYINKGDIKVAIEPEYRCGYGNSL